MSGGDFTSILKRAAAGETLDAAASSRAFAAIMAGEIGEAQMAAFLTALALRKPTVEEIAGAVKAMRAAMKTLEAPAGALDLVGTGGDGHGTLNISSAASFVAAACGVPVAKPLSAYSVSLGWPRFTSVTQTVRVTLSGQ